METPMRVWAVWQKQDQEAKVAYSAHFTAFCA